MSDRALRLIDVHHHIIPPFYLSEYRDQIAALRVGGAIGVSYSEWTPQQTLDAMDANEVATAVLSMSMPGVWFGDANAARTCTRKCNEYAAELARKHSGRFGMFATIALPDTDGALNEIEYALETLRADGVGLLTSYDGKWLGHADYMPVFAELDRRKSVVFVHPTIPESCRGLIPDIRAVIAEAPQDTTRAGVNLLFSGTLSRFPGIRFILPHAGGFLPMIVGRLHQYGPKDLSERVPNGIEYELGRLYYDIAGTAYQPAIAALTSLVPMSQILFGGDFPHVPLEDTARRLTQLGLGEPDRIAIGRDNALRLMPRLASA